MVLGWQVTCFSLAWSRIASLKPHTANPSLSVSFTSIFIYYLDAFFLYHTWLIAYSNFLNFRKKGGGGWAHCHTSPGSNQDSIILFIGPCNNGKHRTKYFGLEAKFISDLSLGGLLNPGSFEQLIGPH